MRPVSFVLRSLLSPLVLVLSRLSRLGAAAVAVALLLGAPAAWSYQTRAGDILDGSGQRIQLRGVNWFGAGSSAGVVQGLWERNWRDMLNQMQELGFNAVRLPFCPATLRGITPSGIDYRRNPDLQGLNSLLLLDALVQELDRRGMYVLLDHHTPDCETISELWYTPDYSEAQWLADLAFVAQRYRSVGRVIGLDLKNEPHGAATWGTGNPATDWNLAAERAAATVLAIAPHWLIAVEGIGSTAHCSSTGGHFWGGNLEPLACTPLAIPPQQLLLAPHVYGPDVHPQPYFDAPDFPLNLLPIWEQHFGRYVQQGYTLALGEFGGRYGQGHPGDAAWQNLLVEYLIAKNMRSGFYWSWNPSSSDTGGILQDDWTGVHTGKVQLLRHLWGKVDASAAPVPAASAKFVVNQATVTDWGAGYCQRVTVRNDGAASGDWSVNAPIAGRVSELWNAVWQQSGNRLVASGAAWNRSLAPGAGTEFGFCARR